MGQAKRRGTYEERKQAAIAEVESIKPLSEEDREAMRQHIAKLDEKQKESTERLIRVYHDKTQFYDRILNSAATPAELKGEKNGR